MAYPTELVSLQPFAAKCELVGNDDDCSRFLAQLKPDELSQFVQLYVRLVDQGAKPHLDSWHKQDGLTKEGAEALRLLVLLDYLARNGHIPEPQASTRFIEWDTREFDDDGNEW